jgi:hypothetical protein
MGIYEFELFNFTFCKKNEMNIYPSLIDRQKTQHQTVREILSVVNIDRIAARPQPSKWNIHDNLAHLARYQTVFITRLDKILHSEATFFGRYKAEEDAEFENYRLLGDDVLIKQLDNDRKTIYELITGLSDSQLNRTGVHKKFGPLTIIEWTEFFLLHEAHHLFTIFQLAHDVEL